jgi:hypothetical protein
MCKPATFVDASELYNYINNTANIWRSVEYEYRSAERAMKANEYVSEFLEAYLMAVVMDGARGYYREYVNRIAPSSKVNAMFPFAIRRECARLLVSNFETEKAAGNSWLG